jgi:hypothetical protein
MEQMSNLMEFNKNQLNGSLVMRWQNINFLITSKTILLKDSVLGVRCVSFLSTTYVWHIFHLSIWWVTLKT